MPLRRSPFRRHGKPRTPRAVRPGATAGYPPRWRATCATVRRRDGNVCRFCGALATSGPVDHIIPRRLLVPREFATLTNLALLCSGCHGVKTGQIEPKLYAGNVQRFDRYLGVIGTPLPSVHLKARAYKRLTEMITHGTSESRPA